MWKGRASCKGMSWRCILLDRRWKRDRCFCSKHYSGSTVPPLVSGLFLSALHPTGTLHSVCRGKVSLGIDSGAAASVIMDNVTKDMDTVRDKTAWVATRLVWVFLQDRIAKAIAATEKGRQRLAHAAARQSGVEGAGSSAVSNESAASRAALASVAMDVNVEPGGEETQEKRTREEEETHRDVRACLAAALSRLGCGNVCHRIVDLRGQEECPSMSEDELNNVEVVLMRSFTSAGHDRAKRQWQWAKGKSKAVVLGHGDESWSMEGMGSHSIGLIMGARWISSDWKPLLHRLSPHGMLHSIVNLRRQILRRLISGSSSGAKCATTIQETSNCFAVVWSLHQTGFWGDSKELATS
eukprot:4216447-Amphidinium_carterae.2